MSLNVLFVYGAGPDEGPFGYGAALRSLRDAVVQNFGAQVYVPRIIDYTEYATLTRLLRKWDDPTILVGHSCGCGSITRAAVELSMEKIPYLMAIAPSIYCEVSPLPPNVMRASQVTSNPADIFNPGARMLLSRSPINNKTAVDEIRSGMMHIQAPASPLARDRLIAEVQHVLAPVVAFAGTHPAAGTSPTIPKP